VEIVCTLDDTIRQLTVWRQDGGDRTVVRGASGQSVSGSAVVVDYEAPLQTPVTYVCQTVDSAGAVSLVSLPSAAVTLKEPRMWFQDPVDPTSAVPVALSRPGGAVSRRAALAPVSRVQDVTVTPLPNSKLPVASATKRRDPEDVPFEIRTTEPTTSQVRALTVEAFPLLVRTGTRAPMLPSLSYMVFPTVTERFIYGPDVTIWTLTGQSVQPPTTPVVVAPRTLDDLADEASTLDGLSGLYASMLNLDRGVHA
jgi:hypothetical protein